MGILSIIWKRFKTLIVFIFLEAIALWLLLSLNVYQNSFLFQTTTAIRTNFLNTFTVWDNYLNLASENRSLISENARLAEELKNKSVLVSSPPREIAGQYHYIPAKVAYNSIGAPDNIIVVNKGYKDGIRSDMAVVSSTGLVGVVYAVTEDYASVMPMINTSFSCLVSVDGNTLSANTSWDGTDFRYIDVKGVPLHLTIQQNDSVFTNNNSTIYPSGELIGLVESVEKADLGKSLSLRVKVSTNFSKLQNVYIVENIDKPQLDSLVNNE
ncbi:rod shape-determining protein MreC [Balneicella halophila]|uniref:Cell shape-determining protein MreC n=1 Tax=Balneicella halophila TaxID=1537566 RepID=A0A7L4UNW5_BALHA|nr:rod shape-determining protein MreC [Balneicella halophila]PVX50714.1 rod shape-determining protein MreC [Balneicella halophila]